MHDFPSDAEGKAITYGVHDMARNEAWVSVGRDHDTPASRAWKQELQRFVDRTRLTIEVSHFPPGTSKWNKIEHRLFCHITANWRGKPLTTHETIVDRIGNTRRAEGLRVKAELDDRQHPTGVTAPKEQMKAMALVPDEFHGEWKLQAGTSMKLANQYRSLS